MYQHTILLSYWSTINLSFIEKLCKHLDNFNNKPFKKKYKCLYNIDSCELLNFPSKIKTIIPQWNYRFYFHSRYISLHFVVEVTFLYALQLHPFDSFVWVRCCFLKRYTLQYNIPMQHVVQLNSLYIKFKSKLKKQLYNKYYN